MDANELADSEPPVVLVVGPWTEAPGGVLTFQRHLAEYASGSGPWRVVPFNTSRPDREEGVGQGYRAALRGGPGRFLRAMAVSVVNVLRLPLHVARASVLQIQSSDYFSFWEAMLHVVIARCMGRPVCVRFGGACFPRFYEESSPLLKRLIEAGVRQPDAVVVLSQTARDYFAHLVPGERLHIIPNVVAGPIEERTGGARAGLPRALFLCGSEPRRKGVEDVLAAAPSLRGKVEIVILAASASLRSRVAQMGLSDVITAYGPQGREELRDRFYPEADIFLLPSHDEGMPNSLLEAMAAGLPVVTCAVGAIAEMVEPEVHAFLNSPGDVDALVRDVLTLAEDPELRYAMGRAGQARVRERHLREEVFDQYPRVWQAAMN